MPATISMLVSPLPQGLGKAVAQTKTTTNPNGATLDFTAATWTKNTGATPGIILNGRVFGENTAF